MIKRFKIFEQQREEDLDDPWGEEKKVSLLPDYWIIHIEDVEDILDGFENLFVNSLHLHFYTVNDYCDDDNYNVIISDANLNGVQIEKICKNDGKYDETDYVFIKCEDFNDMIGLFNDAIEHYGFHLYEDIDVNGAKFIVSKEPLSEEAILQILDYEDENY